MNNLNSRDLHQNSIIEDPAQAAGMVELKEAYDSPLFKDLLSLRYNLDFVLDRYKLDDKLAKFISTVLMNSIAKDEVKDSDIIPYLEISLAKIHNLRAKLNKWQESNFTIINCVEIEKGTFKYEMTEKLKADLTSRLELIKKLKAKSQTESK